MKIKWLTKEEVRAYATTPKRALVISIRHHQQNVDATEKQLATQDAPLGEELCGLCRYYKELYNGGCDKCPLLTNGNSCHATGSLYQTARHCYLDGDHKAFIKAETALLNRLKQLKSGDKSMKKEEIEIRIKQNDADQERLRDEAEALKQQLAEEEVTYSIGDRFKNNYGGGKRIIIAVSDSASDGNAKTWVMFSDLKDGHGMSRQVKNWNNITESELGSISTDYTRYWDARKKVHCG